MIKLFQYHKFRELLLIEQNVEVKIDLEIVSVSLNVYNLCVSSFEKVAVVKRLPFCFCRGTNLNKRRNFETFTFLPKSLLWKRRDLVEPFGSIKQCGKATSLFSKVWGSSFEKVAAQKRLPFLSNVERLTSNDK